MSEYEFMIELHVEQEDFCLENIKSFLAYRKSIGKGNDEILKKGNPSAYFIKICKNSIAAWDLYSEWLNGDPCADGWKS